MSCEKHAKYVLLAQLSGDMVSGHGVSHSQKTTSEGSQRVSSQELPDHLSQTPGEQLDTETASPGRLCRELSYRTDRALKQCTRKSVARNWHVSGAFLCTLRISRKHLIVFPTTALLKCYVAKTFVLACWWCFSSLEVRFGHVTSDRCISVDQGGAAGSARVLWCS